MDLIGMSLILGLSKYNIKQLINADYGSGDSNAVFNFLMSYVKENTNVFYQRMIELNLIV